MLMPQPIDAATQVFPANVAHLMPLTEPDYKEKYLRGWHNNSTWGFKLFNEWFYNGVKDLKLVPKDGIDPDIAMSNIQAVMGSFHPSHEDKTASVAWMLEHWFKSATWEKRNNQPK